MTAKKNETTAFPLEYPLAGENGEVIENLLLRRPQVRDLMAMQRAAKDEGGIRTVIGLDGKPTIEATEEAQLKGTMALLSSMTGVPVAVLETMDVSEFNRIEVIIGGFFQKGRSETSAP